MSNKTAAMILQELSIKIAAVPPEFSLLHRLQEKHDNEFRYRVDVLGMSATGKGRSKKEAKQDASRKVLAKLKEKNIYNSDEGLVVTMENNAMDNVELKQVVNYIGILGDICSYYILSPPQYISVSEAGPPHAREFTYECHVCSLKTRATANSKKQARQIVARVMLDKLADVVPQIKSGQEKHLRELGNNEAQAIEMYNDLSVLTKLNLGLQVQDYNRNLRHIMNEKDIKFEDIEMYLVDMDESKLTLLLEKFGMNFSFENVTQEDEIFTTVILNIPADIPLCTMGQAVDLPGAKDRALVRMYELIITLLTPNKNVKE